MSQLLSFIVKICNTLRTAPRAPRIIFPEGDNPKIIAVAKRASIEKYFEPILVTEKKLNFCKTIWYDTIDETKLVKKLLEVRKGKITEDEAKMLLRKSIYLAALLLVNGEADGFVGGIDYSTADIIRTGFQIVKKRDDVPLAASCMILTNAAKTLIFADVSVNIKPLADDLVSIALQAHSFSKLIFDHEPQLAMLSFSTSGSAKSSESQIVAEATAKLKSLNPPFIFDGEIQADAALNEEVRKKKFPNCRLTQNANILIFPNLDAGNIGYKLVERLGGYEAIGPIVTGLKLPFNDLSRGADEKDIYLVALLTAIQSLEITNNPL